MVAGTVLCCGGFLWVGSGVLRHTLRSIVRVTQPNANLQQAIREARRQLPRFEARLKHPEPGDRFAIKAKFSTPYMPEYLWMKDPTRLKNGFEGIVDQVPASVPNLKRGDKVQVPDSAVVDWLIRRADGSMTGGFTDLALGGGPR